MTRKKAWTAIELAAAKRRRWRRLAHYELTTSGTPIRETMAHLRRVQRSEKSAATKRRAWARDEYERQRPPVPFAAKMNLRIHGVLAGMTTHERLEGARVSFPEVMAKYRRSCVFDVNDPSDYEDWYTRTLRSLSYHRRALRDQATRSGMTGWGHPTPVQNRDHVKLELVIMFLRDGSPELWAKWLHTNRVQEAQRVEHEAKTAQRQWAKEARRLGLLNPNICSTL